MMKELRLDYPKCVLGRLLNVSASGYYAWVDRPSSRRAQEEVRLELEIRAAHKRTRQTYGPERLQRDLAEHGVRVGICRIKRIRKKLGIRCRQKRRFKALGRDGAADGRTAPAGLRHPPPPNRTCDFHRIRLSIRWVRPVCREHRLFRHPRRVHTSPLRRSSLRSTPI